MKRLSFLLILTLWAHTSFAQKKKEMKKNGIKTLTITEVYANYGTEELPLPTEEQPNTKTLLAEKNFFDREGRVTEKWNYTEGVLKSVTRYKYNSENEVTEETAYDDKNVLQEKQSIKYNAKGQKIEELVTDKAGKQLKKHIYSYAANGLKTERKTYNATNILVLTKKYTYDYK